jgi:hypothetical protein
MADGRDGILEFCRRNWLGPPLSEEELLRERPNSRYSAGFSSRAVSTPPGSRETNAVMQPEVHADRDQKVSTVASTRSGPLRIYFQPPLRSRSTPPVNV